MKGINEEDAARPGRTNVTREERETVGRPIWSDSGRWSACAPPQHRNPTLCETVRPIHLPCTAPWRRHNLAAFWANAQSRGAISGPAPRKRPAARPQRRGKRPMGVSLPNKAEQEAVIASRALHCPPIPPGCQAAFGACRGLPCNFVHKWRRGAPRDAPAPWTDPGPSAGPSRVTSDRPST